MIPTSLVAPPPSCMRATNCVSRAVVARGTRLLRRAIVSASLGWQGLEGERADRRMGNGLGERRRRAQTRYRTC